MKQRITTGQLDELNDKQKNRLHEYLFGRDLRGSVGVDSPEKYLSIALLSIGQMIELLQRYRSDRRYKTGYPDTISFYQEPYECCDGWTIYPDRLCDDLWEAVKKELS